MANFQCSLHQAQSTQLRAEASQGLSVEEAKYLYHLLQPYVGLHVLHTWRPQGKEETEAFLKRLSGLGERLLAHERYELAWRWYAELKEAAAQTLTSWVPLCSAPGLV